MSTQIALTAQYFQIATESSLVAFKVIAKLLMVLKIIDSFMNLIGYSVYSVLNNFFRDLSHGRIVLCKYEHSCSLLYTY